MSDLSNKDEILYKATSQAIIRAYPETLEQVRNDRSFEVNLVESAKISATPAGKKELSLKYRDIGQPIFIPGSMGSASWILLGHPNSMNITFGSTAHGAGRTMSRTRSYNMHNYKQVIEELEKKNIVLRSKTRGGVVEEAPEAYKDVDKIVSISHEVKMATKVASSYQ